MAPNGIDQRQGSITVRPLKLEDVEGFGSWGHHTDIRFHGYDFPDLAAGWGGYSLQSRLWFYQRQVPSLRWLYGIEDASGHLAGYLKAVRKRFLHSSAEISIVLDPALIEKGYGSEATRQFLHICFNDLKLKEVWLRVVQFNVRARRVYEKAGFHYFTTREEPYDNQRDREELLRQFPQEFFMKEGKLMSHYHYMKLSRQTFEAGG